MKITERKLKLIILFKDKREKDMYLNLTNPFLREIKPKNNR